MRNSSDSRPEKIKANLVSYGDEHSHYLRRTMLSGYIDKAGSGQLTSHDKMEMLLALTPDAIPSSLNGIFINFSGWFKSLPTTFAASPNGLSLLDDTIEFVKTGYRRMPIAVRLSLIQHEKLVNKNGIITTTQPASARLANEALNAVRPKLCEVDETFLYRWARQEGGLYDIVLFFRGILALEIECVASDRFYQY